MRSMPFMLEGIGLLLIVLFYLTQILIPQMRGLPLFPWFNKTTAKLEKRLAALRELEATSAIEAEIRRIEAKLKKATRSTP